MKRMTAIVLAVVLALALVPAAGAAEDITYIERSYSYDTGKVTEQTKTVSATKWTTQTELVGGPEGTWYYIDNDSSFNLASNTDVTYTGDVHLILCDGANAQLGNLRDENTRSTLNIYSQSSGSNEGKLTLDSTFNSGLFAYYFTMHGGVIDANGTAIDAAASVSTLTMLGGTLRLTGGAATISTLKVSVELNIHGGFLASTYTGGGQDAIEVSAYLTMTGGALWAQSTSGAGLYVAGNGQISGGHLYARGNTIDIQTLVGAQIHVTGGVVDVNRAAYSPATGGDNPLTRSYDGPTLWATRIEGLEAGSYVLERNGISYPFTIAASNPYPGFTMPEGLYNDQKDGTGVYVLLPETFPTEYIYEAVTPSNYAYKSDPALIGAVHRDNVIHFPGDGYQRSSGGGDWTTIYGDSTDSKTNPHTGR